MRDKLKKPQGSVANISPEVLKSIYKAEHRPTHDQKWAELDATDAPLARAALIRAEELRVEQVDPGDAYLQGVADFRAAKVRQHLIDDIANSDPRTIIQAKK